MTLTPSHPSPSPDPHTTDHRAKIRDIIIPSAGVAMEWDQQELSSNVAIDELNKTYLAAILALPEMQNEKEQFGDRGVKWDDAFAEERNKVRVMLRTALTRAFHPNPELDTDIDVGNKTDSVMKEGE